MGIRREVLRTANSFDRWVRLQNEIDQKAAEAAAREEALAHSQLGILADDVEETPEHQHRRPSRNRARTRNRVQEDFLEKLFEDNIKK